MLTFKNYNIADWISFSRIAMAPVLLTLMWFDQRELFTWLLLFTYCTDMADGFIARRLKITSPRGSQLDSFGDQVNFTVAVLGLVVFEYNFIRDNIFLILLVFVPYLIQMFIAFWKYGKATAFHTYMAKLSAIVQGVFILWLLFFGPLYWLFYTMIILGLLETIEEIILIFMYDNWVSGVKGIYWALRDKRRLKKANQTNES